MRERRVETALGEIGVAIDDGEASESIFGARSVDGLLPTPSRL